MKGRRHAILSTAIILIAVFVTVVVIRGPLRHHLTSGASGNPIFEQKHATADNSSPASGKSTDRSETAKQGENPDGAARPVQKPYGTGVDGLESQRLLTELLEKRGLAGLTQLLKDYGNHPDEVGHMSRRLYIDLEATVPTAYKAGQLGTASELIDLLAAANSSYLLVNETGPKLLDKQHPEKALQEVLQKPTQANPDDYGGLFARAASAMGYEKALGMVDEMASGPAVKVAYQYMFTGWLSKDQQAAMKHIESLPASHLLRESAPEFIARYAILNDSFDIAEEWIPLVKDPERAKGLRSDLKISRDGIPLDSNGDPIK